MNSKKQQQTKGAKKPMKEKTLINKINRLLPEAKAVSASYFDGRDGIWFKGSEDCANDDIPIYDYWNEFELTYDGVHPKLNKILDDAGWYSEPYDAGTLMAYEG